MNQPDRATTGTLPTTPSAACKTLQIITAALLVGTTAFIVVAVIVGPLDTASWDAGTALAMRIVAGVMTFAAAIIPSIVSVVSTPKVRAHLASSADEQERMRLAIGAVITKHIIGVAPAEALALFAGVMTLLAGAGVDMLFWVAGTAMLIFRFPTTSKVTESTRELLDERQPVRPE